MNAASQTPGDYRFRDGWLIHDLAHYDLANEVSRATVFALANGYMGVRGAAECAPLGQPGLVGTHVNGLYDTPTGGILDREMVNLPAWTAIQLEVDGSVLDLSAAERKEYTRTLDMRRGVLRQSVRWLTADGREVTLHSERFVSMARLHLAAIRWRLEASAPCAVTIRSAIDAAVTNRFAPGHFAQVDPHAEDRCCSVEITTVDPGYRAIVAAAHALADSGPEVAWRGETAPQRAATHLSFALPAGQPVTMTKFVTVYDSLFSAGDLATLARIDLEAAESAGYDALLAEHGARWAELWAASDVSIVGDEQAQVALRFCLFHLLANLPHSERVSVSARGLQGQDYWGSIFWDCEIYVLPFFTYTQPEYARRSLLYRFHTLDGARRKAESLGFRGAYYPWQSQESGDETCALYVFDDPRTGQKVRSYFADEQIHISADVVYALWQYVQASGDWAFMAEYGAEIACEVARFFVSRATYNAALEHYELRTVLGPDEYHERVDNNAYTNALARFSLDVALAALNRLRDDNREALARLEARIGLMAAEVETWRAVAARLYVPAPDADSGLIAQFDGYFSLEDAPPDVVRARLSHPDQYRGGPLGPYQATQSIKQADVVLLTYLLRDAYTLAHKQANWHYYEPRTAHDSSLSPMAYALVAADIGLTEWAYRYFLQTAMIDLLGTGPHWNLGVHTAALGGAWQAVVQGFCQLDLREEGVCLHAWPRLPAAWQQVSFGFSWHGHVVRFTADRRRVVLQAESGPVPVVHPDGQAEISPGQTLVLSFTA